MNIDFTPRRSVLDIEQFILDNDNFIILGNGFEAKRIFARLQKYGKNVVGILDLDDKLSTVTLESVVAEGHRILVASLNDYGSNNWELTSQNKLLSAGLKPYKDFVCLMGYFLGMEHLERYNKLFGRPFYEFFSANKSSFKRAYQSLSDEYSKAIFVKVIEYKLKATEPEAFDADILPTPLEKLAEFDKLAEEIDFNTAYAINESLKNAIGRNLAVLPYSYCDIVTPNNKQCVIDAGGFTGDTAVMFELLGAKSVYSFEPIDSLYEKLQDISNVSNVISAHKKGLWDKTTTLRFTTLKRDGYIGMGSFISQEGEDSIEVVSLDEFILENNIQDIDFIKMDIEGAEIEALNGAIKTIEKYKPDLAICIYHVDSHLWEIPLWIKNNFPNYNLYIDHKHIHPAETVCYATVKKGF